MNSLLTLSTHEIAKKIVDKAGRDGVCLILNELIRKKLSYSGGPYEYQDSVVISKTPTVEILYDTPAAVYNLYVDSGFREQVYDPENMYLAKNALYYFNLIDRDTCGDTRDRLRLDLAVHLLAAPDRKIVVPTVTCSIEPFTSDRKQITYLRF
jgi:hypothetical protein